MRIFKVDLRLPRLTELAYVPLAFSLGMVLASLMQIHGTKSPALVFGMGAAAATATFLALAGANLDAGRRGVAITLAGSMVSFLGTVVLHAAIG